MAQKMFEFKDIEVGKPFIHIATLYIKTTKQKGMAVLIKSKSENKAKTFKESDAVELAIKLSYRGSAGSSANDPLGVA